MDNQQTLSQLFGDRKGNTWLNDERNKFIRGFRKYGKDYNKLYQFFGGTHPKSAIQSYCGHFFKKLKKASPHLQEEYADMIRVFDKKNPIWKPISSDAVCELEKQMAQELDDNSEVEILPFKRRVRKQSSQSDDDSTSAKRRYDKSDRWSKEESCKLFTALRLYGKNYREIHRYLGGNKTMHQIYRKVGRYANLLKPKEVKMEGEEESGGDDQEDLKGDDLEVEKEKSQSQASLGQIANVTKRSELLKTKKSRGKVLDIKQKQAQNQSTTINPPLPNSKDELKSYITQNLLKLKADQIFPFLQIITEQLNQSQLYIDLDLNKQSPEVLQKLFTNLKSREKQKQQQNGFVNANHTKLTPTEKRTILGKRYLRDNQDNGKAKTKKKSS